MEFQIADFKFQITDCRSQISHYRFQNSESFPARCDAFCFCRTLGGWRFCGERKKTAAADPHGLVPWVKKFKGYRDAVIATELSLLPGKPAGGVGQAAAL